jgi:putative ABC transport system substrate-binding protein
LLTAYADAATRRFNIVFVTPVKSQYPLEDVLKSVLDSRVSANITRITWSTRSEDREDLINRVRAANPDLIYTWGTPTTIAIGGTYDHVDPNKNIVDIPIVFATVAWPDQTRIVFNLKRPGRNVTGVTHVVPVAEQMNTLLRWGVLKQRSIGTIYNALEPNSLISTQALQRWCDENRVALYAEPITPSRDVRADGLNIKNAIDRLSTKEPGKNNLNT